MIFRVVRIRTPWFSKMKAGRDGWAGGRIEITIVGDRLLEYAGYVSLVQVHSGVTMTRRAMFLPSSERYSRSDFGAHSEFAFDFRLAIDQELDGVHAPVLPQLYGEFSISHGGDLPRQQLLVRGRFEVNRGRPGGERRGPGCHGETNQKQGG
jgi:hypothetical protein